MRKIFFFICILLSFTELSANNKHFKPGYIILESGDTIQGFIKNSSWRISPTHIIFTSKEINNDTLSYSMKSLKGFSSNDFIFVKKKVKIDQQANDINHLDNYSLLPPYREDTVFLQVLVRGEASLYIYIESKGRNHYYIESRTSELQELLNTLYIKRITTSTGITKNYVGYSEEYKTQLLITLIGCKTITYKEIDIEFKESELYKLLLKYNECVSPNTKIYSKEIEKWEIKPYVSAGIDIASTHFKTNSSYYYYLINLDFSNSTNFTANIGLQYIIPKYNKKLSLYTDIAYNSYKFESQNDQTIGISTYHYIIDYSQIGVNYGLLYDFSNHQSSLYLRAGISTIFSFAYNMQKIDIDTDYPYDFVLNPRKFQWGLNFGAGINFSSIAIEYQILLATGFSSEPDLKNTPVTNYIMLKYTFNSNHKK